MPTEDDCTPITRGYSRLQEDTGMTVVLAGGINIRTPDNSS